MKCVGFSSSKAGHNLLVCSCFVCLFFPPKCIPESRNVQWSGGEEWNSGKVGCIMEMTTFAGKWSLSPQDQNLTKCIQNRSLEDLSMDIHLNSGRWLWKQLISEHLHVFLKFQSCEMGGICIDLVAVAVAGVDMWVKIFLTGPLERTKRRWGSFRRLKCMSDMIRISSSDTVEIIFTHSLSSKLYVYQVSYNFLYSEGTTVRRTNAITILLQFIKCLGYNTRRTCPWILNITLHPRICLPSISAPWGHLIYHCNKKHI